LGYRAVLSGYQNHYGNEYSTLQVLDLVAFYTVPCFTLSLSERSIFAEFAG
jgi:hypothetical protein